MGLFEERIFFREGSFRRGGGNFQRKSYTGGFCQSSPTKSFFLSYFLFADLILRVEMFQGNCSGNIFSGLELLRGFFLGGGVSEGPTVDFQKFRLDNVIKYLRSQLPYKF